MGLLLCRLITTLEDKPDNCWLGSYTAYDEKAKK